MRYLFFYRYIWQPTKVKRLSRVFIKTLWNQHLSVHVVDGLSTFNSNSSNANNKVATARLLWKNKWLQNYDWFQFNKELGVMYWKNCKE